jgi:hypothetical protein
MRDDTMGSLLWIEIRDPAISECHIDVLIPQNLLDKLKIASSRDPSGVVAINREYTAPGKQVLYTTSKSGYSLTLFSTLLIPLDLPSSPLVLCCFAVSLYW